MKKHYGWVILAAVTIVAGLGSAQAQEYAGADKCISCHEDQAKTYHATGHGQQAIAESPANVRGCETCHGAGAEHVRLAEETGEGQKAPKASSEACLSCHNSGAQAHWKGSAHENRDVDCLKCHSVHAGHPRNLAKPTVAEVCSTCHQRIDAQSKKNSHHPIQEGKVTCADCHNPHGTTTDKLITAVTVNDKCFQCHAEKRGPFLWEHAPVTEDCMNCHTPHGSTSEKLLKAKLPTLCQRCHSDSRHPGTLYSLNAPQIDAGETTYTALSARAIYKACRNCHTQIHGSNHPGGKPFTR